MTVEENQRLGREAATRRLMLKRARVGKNKIDKLLAKHNLEIEKSENEKRQLQEELEKLNQIILESKRVDIEIEAKKRQSAQ